MLFIFIVLKITINIESQRHEKLPGKGQFYLAGC